MKVDVEYHDSISLFTFVSLLFCHSYCCSKHLKEFFPPPQLYSKGRNWTLRTSKYLKEKYSKIVLVPFDTRLIIELPIGTMSLDPSLPRDPILWSCLRKSAVILLKWVSRLWPLEQYAPSLSREAFWTCHAKGAEASARFSLQALEILRGRVVRLRRALVRLLTP